MCIIVWYLSLSLSLLIQILYIIQLKYKAQADLPFNRSNVIFSRQLKKRNKRQGQNREEKKN